MNPPLIAFATRASGREDLLLGRQLVGYVRPHDGPRGARALWQIFLPRETSRSWQGAADVVQARRALLCAVAEWFEAADMPLVAQACWLEASERERAIA